MSKIQVDTIDTRSGTSTMQIGSTNTSTINIGVSGETVNIPSGVTIANAGTATGFGENNTPSWLVRYNGEQSLSDYSTGIFTVPSGKGGKYAFFVSGGYDDNGDINICNFWLSKNNQTAISPAGGLAIGIDYFHKGTSAQNIAQQVSGCFDLAAGDTMRVYTWQNYGSARDLNQGGRMTFSGFKLL